MLRAPSGLRTISPLQLACRNRYLERLDGAVLQPLLAWHAEHDPAAAAVLAAGPLGRAAGAAGAQEGGGGAVARSRDFVQLRVSGWWAYRWADGLVGSGSAGGGAAGQGGGDGRGIGRGAAAGGSAAACSWDFVQLRLGWVGGGTLE